MKVRSTLTYAALVFGSMAAGQDSLTHTEGMQRSWTVRAQFAGYQGLASVGGGPVLAGGVWRPLLMYGFAPANSTRPSVHQIILRNDIVFMPWRDGKDAALSPTLSLNALLETGNNSYLRLPDQFPRGYYMTPEVHMTFGLGGRYERRWSSRGLPRSWAFTTELVALDTYLYYAITNKGFPLYAAYGLSFGFEVGF